MTDGVISPWTPEKRQRVLAAVGKLAEEANELAGRCARIIVQGLDAQDPKTFRLNSEELRDEMSDVAAAMQLLQELTGLDVKSDRYERKLEGFRRWQGMLTQMHGEENLPALNSSRDVRKEVLLEDLNALEAFLDALTFLTLMVQECGVPDELPHVDKLNALHVGAQNVRHRLHPSIAVPLFDTFSNFYSRIMVYAEHPSDSPLRVQIREDVKVDNARLAVAVKTALSTVKALIIRETKGDFHAG